MDPLAADFRRDGACAVRGLLDADEVERLSAAVDAHMADPGPMAIEGGGDATSGRFFEDFRNWDRIDAYEEVIRDSRIGEVAAALMGSSHGPPPPVHLLVKEPGTTIRTPWHQDQPYYNIDGAQTVSFWIPLDPVPRESTLEFVARSHAVAHVVHAALVLRRPARSSSRTARSARPPTSRPTAPRSTILGWPLEPGDAVAFNMLTLHAAAGLRNRRRAFSVRLVGDDVRLRGPPVCDEPAVPGARGRARRRRRARPPAVPAALAAGLSGAPANVNCGWVRGGGAVAVARSRPREPRVATYRPYTAINSPLALLTGRNRARGRRSHLPTQPPFKTPRTRARHLAQRLARRSPRRRVPAGCCWRLNGIASKSISTSPTSSSSTSSPAASRPRVSSSTSATTRSTSSSDSAIRSQPWRSSRSAVRVRCASARSNPPAALEARP